MQQHDHRAIIGLSWPIFVAQIAVMASGISDTIMTGHYSSTHLAAVGIGAGVYATAFVGLMGVVQALSPIIARDFGAGDFRHIGLQVRQGIWIALGLSAVGGSILYFTHAILELAGVPPEVARLAESYLRVIAWGLPLSLITRVFYSFTPAVGRSRPVMVINLCAVLVKIPVSYVLLHGLFGLPEMGVAGCAAGTLAMFACMFTASMTLMLKDPFYARFDIAGPRADRYRPHWPEMKRILALGIPIAGAILIEVTSFTMIALVLAPMGAIVSASHQVAGNLAALMFMMPMAIGTGTQVLIGQNLGRKDPERARAVAIAGLKLGGGIAFGMCMTLFLARSQIASLYTSDAAVITLVTSLIALVASFHFFDAVQGVAGQALRGYQRTMVPTIINALALWGVGLIGGWWLTWGRAERVHAALGFGVGSPFGMWGAAMLGLMAAAAALVWYLLHVSVPSRAMTALPPAR